jgi:ATP-dependent RNA helicase RhlE
MLKTFDQLGVIKPILRALTDEGYKAPTPIQISAIPHLLAGRDLFGLAQTGTGKTAAFAIPMLQFLAEGPRAKSRAPRAVILTPTRELALQVGRSIETYGKYLSLSGVVINGGVSQGPQDKALFRGADIVTATPGRLLDLMQQRLVNLGSVEILVLDEADRMLDMGFVHDVRRIAAATPKKRQTLLFSATMPREIKSLAADLLNDPATAAVDPVSSAHPKIDQKVMFVEKRHKDQLLCELLKDESMFRALVFTRTKHGANKLCTSLMKNRHSAEAIHGNKSQAARQRALANFVSGRTRILVATDIAARGIDVEGITHVINFELPNEPESYVHRIGRTARAGAEGIAISFCGPDERGNLRSIERILNKRINVVEDHPMRAGNGSSQMASREGSGASHFSPREVSGPSQVSHSRRPNMARRAW